MANNLHFRSFVEERLIIFVKRLALAFVLVVVPVLLAFFMSSVWLIYLVTGIVAAVLIVVFHYRQQWEFQTSLLPILGLQYFNVRRPRFFRRSGARLWMVYRKALLNHVIEEDDFEFIVQRLAIRDQLDRLLQRIPFFLQSELPGRSSTDNLFLAVRDTPIGDLYGNEEYWGFVYFSLEDYIEGTKLLLSKKRLLRFPGHEAIYYEELSRLEKEMKRLDYGDFIERMTLGNVGEFWRRTRQPHGRFGINFIRALLHRLWKMLGQSQSIDD